MDNEDAVRRAVTVPLARERAFALFADLQAWWPPEFSWSGAALDRLGMEPHEGGMCFELGPHGFRCDWGRVVAWEPPGRLVFLWQIAPTRAPEPDPARASEVEVAFRAEDDPFTWVDVEHRHFARHGEGADAYRAGMASPQGWSYMLERYLTAAEEPGRR